MKCPVRNPEYLTALERRILRVLTKGVNQTIPEISEELHCKRKEVDDIMSFLCARNFIQRGKLIMVHGGYWHQWTVTEITQKGLAEGWYVDPNL
jgi:predicted transcriptional regulator